MGVSWAGTVTVAEGKQTGETVVTRCDIGSEFVYV